MKSKKSDEEFLMEDFDFEKAQQGAVLTPKGAKLPVSIRLDIDVISYFKKEAERSGENKYQTMINDALKEYIHGVNVRKILLSEEFVTKLSKKIFAGKSAAIKKKALK